MNRRELLAAAAAVPIALAFPARSESRGAGGTWLTLVTADTEAHVVAVELATGRVVARVPTLPGPRSIESARQTWAIVAHTALGRLSLLHGPTLAVRRVMTGFREPRYTAVHPLGRLAYVTDSAAREVVTIDIASGSVVSRASVPGPARHVTISPAGDQIWTALGSTAERIAVLDTTDARRPQLVRTIAPPFLAHDVVFAPDGGHVWVTSGAGRRVAVYVRRGRRPVTMIAALGAPQHVAFVGTKAFVASGADGVLRVHALDGELVHEAQVPVGSFNVSVGGARAVTPSLAQGTVALLDSVGGVRAVRRVARAAHDACVVVGA